MPKVSYTNQENFIKRYLYNYIVDHAFREAHNKATKLNARKVRLLAIEKYGSVCACCSEGRVEFLAIDHINGGGNKHRREVGAKNMFWWLKKNNWPSGFRVLCHNCNMAIGFYKKCPHVTEIIE